MIGLNNINERSAVFYHGALRWRWDVAAADSDDIMAATVVAAWTGTQVLSTADVWVRNIQGIAFQIVSDAAGDTAKSFDVLITGENQFGETIVETISSTLNGTTPRVVQSARCFRRVTNVTMTNFGSTVAGTITAQIGFSLNTGLRLPSWARNPNRNWFLRVVCGTSGAAHPTGTVSIDVPNETLILAGASTAGPYYAYLDKQYKNYM